MTIEPTRGKGEGLTYMPLSKDFDQQLHRRLLRGDPTAASDVILAYLQPLFRRLRQRFPHIEDETLIQDAATDALFQYVQSPERFDPTKSSLFSYLMMAARGDLLNALARERKRATRQIPLKAVANSALARNTTIEENEVAEDPMIVSPRVQAILQHISDPVDRGLLEMMLAGERKTASYAQVLGITDQSEAEQRKIVKRHKDRLKKRLQRLWFKLT